MGISALECLFLANRMLGGVWVERAVKLEHEKILIFMNVFAGSTVRQPETMAKQEVSEIKRRQARFGN